MKLEIKPGLVAIEGSTACQQHTWATCSPIEVVPRCFWRDDVVLDVGEHIEGFFV